MTISEMKVKKREMEWAIENAIRQFQDDTGVNVTSVNIWFVRRLGSKKKHAPMVEVESKVEL